MALLAPAARELSGEAEAQGYNWTTVTVDGTELTGAYNSIALSGSGNPMISYEDWANRDLEFATCDLSASSYGRCDQPTDWERVTIDASNVGTFSAIAAESSEHAMISYNDATNGDLKFAVCDLSESTNGNCDQTADWTTVVVDATGNAGSNSSIAVASSGDPMVSYYEGTNSDVKFAICDVSASANGDCDQTGDWTTVTVDATGNVGQYLSIVADSSGDPMISYYDATNLDLKFATCDLSESTNANCDQTADWTTVVVHSEGHTGVYPSMALVSGQDPAIVFWNGSLKFAVCDLSESTNGNCNQTTDWKVATVDALGGKFPSMTATSAGDLMVSYEDCTTDLQFAIWFAICDVSESTNGNCDQTADWSAEAVDDEGASWSSIAVSQSGHPMISYYDGTLQFAVGSPLSVGGIAELPDVAQGPASEEDVSADGPSPSTQRYVALAGSVAAVLVALTGGAWYARRRWGR